MESTTDFDNSMTTEQRNLHPFLDTDGKNLEVIARNTFIFLGVVVIISGFLLGYRDKLSINLCWACMIAGVLGSTSSALLSALQRKANGWETVASDKYPSDGKGDRFSQRMSTFFLYRPIFGIIAGLLVFFGVQTGYFGSMTVNEEAKVIFYSLLSGLFVKSLLEKLKDLFDSLVGKPK